MTPKATPSTAVMALRQIIAAPLQAAMEAQTAQSLATANLVRQIGFDDRQQPVMTDFSYQRADGDTVQLQVPLLSLIPLTCLRIQEVNVDFNVKMNTAAYAGLANRRSTGNASYQMHMQVKAVQDELPASFTDALHIPS